MPEFNPVPKEEDKKTKRTQINNRNRKRGKTAEKVVSELTGGYRTAMSGAMKWSNQLGDIHVPVREGSSDLIAMIEVKTAATLTPKGDKVFSLKKSVLDQATKEASILKTIPVVWLHYNNTSYEQDDYVIIPAPSFLRLLELVKHTENFTK